MNVQSHEEKPSGGKLQKEHNFLVWTTAVTKKTLCQEVLIRVTTTIRAVLT